MGAIAEKRLRHWIAMDQVEEYLEGSKFRFETISQATEAKASMNPEHKKARWAEVLDGQTVWERNKVCAGDDDKFRTEYVDPLKTLQAEGKFEIRIITRNMRGRANVPTAVQIASAINYD